MDERRYRKKKRSFIEINEEDKEGEKYMKKIKNDYRKNMKEEKGLKRKLEK